MDISDLEFEIHEILNDKQLSNEKKRQLLNTIEKDHPQQVFIKTNFCDCGKMGVEVWFKKIDFSVFETGTVREVKTL